MGLQRESVLSLRQRRWITIPNMHGLEVQIDPSQAKLLSGIIESDIFDRRICEEVFVGFKGYMDGDEPVQNTTEARLELWCVLPIQREIRNKAIELNAAIQSGEESGASD